MKKLRFVAAMLSLCFCSGVLAEIAVIVHPSNAATIGEGDIKRIFLGKSNKFPGGGSVVPMATSGAVSDEFNKKVLGKSTSQMKSYWSRLVFTGKATPPKEVGEAEMLDLISQNPDLIGFVSAGSIADGVKVVANF